MRLHAETRGQGPELVLLHGWGMNNGVWEPLLPELAKQARVTCIELPGHGASPAAELPAGARVEAVLDAWLEAILRTAPPAAHWAGWSLGGRLALGLAQRAPERVRSLLGIAATPRFLQGPDWPAAVAPGVFETFSSALTENPQKTIERFLALQVRGADQARETLRRLKQALAARPQPAQAGLQQGLALLQGLDMRPALAALQCPVYWLLGERDTLAPAALSGALLALNPRMRVQVIPKAGHAPALSHPQTVLQAIRKQLDP